MMIPDALSDTLWVVMTFFFPVWLVLWEHLLLFPQLLLGCFSWFLVVYPLHVLMSIVLNAHGRPTPDLCNSFCSVVFSVVHCPGLGFSTQEVHPFHKGFFGLCHNLETVNAMNCDSHWATCLSRINAFCCLVFSVLKIISHTSSISFVI